ncbi:MAG: glycosyltransferase family 2 protein [Lachnospiraceae bacterium]|nr:glycosyltransferase family 2 protein [Lachnospiraceae bacterium]
MEKTAVLLTCHNRKEHTIGCILSLLEGVEERKDLCFVAVDAGSTDGTREALQELVRQGIRIKYIPAPDSLFWNGGMRIAMAYAAKHMSDSAYVLLVNDDVRFYPQAVEKLIARQQMYKSDAVAGSTEDAGGRQSYGGVRQCSKYLARFALIPPTEKPELCDTFNCNCLLMTYDCFRRMGNLDKAYVHSMGDYDYGLRMKHRGAIVINSGAHVGSCDDNDISGSWKDPSLDRKTRLQRKEGPKGLPAKDWYHFIRKNYSLPAAVYHSMTPYLRILLGK